MGRFDKFVSKEIKQRSNKIKINPYELTDVAGKTVAKISSFKTNEDSTSALEEFYCKNDYEFFKFLYNIETRKTLDNLDFGSEMEQLLNQLTTELEAHPNIPDTQIVVAGGFSAGKSSFLNTISGANDLLPTGIDPVSMVSTYLTLSKNTQEPIVTGLNQSKVLVRLNKEILQSIKHSDDFSAVPLASVLEKLFVEVHHDEYDGVCFIDTPGYNNSSESNVDNGIADSDMASNSFKDGNVLFWIIDIEAGSINAKDLGMIQQFVDAHEGNGKIAIIFSKADKKSEDEITKIVNQAAVTIKMDQRKDIVDILAYSCTNNKVYSSLAGYTTIGQLIQCVKTEHFSVVENYKNQLLYLFDHEIEGYDYEIQNTKKWYEEVTQRMSDNINYISDFNKEKDTLKDVLNTYLMDSYDDLLKSMKKASDKWCDMNNAWCNFYNEVQHWDAVDHDCFDNTLTPILNRGCNSFEKHNKIYSDFNWNYYTKEQRKAAVDKCVEQFDKLSEQYERYTANDEQDLTNGKNSCELAENNKSKMQQFKIEFETALNKDLNTYKSLTKKLANDASYCVPDKLNVYDCIENDDYFSFRLCFASKEGVNLEDRNNEKYSPLTFAVKCGNIEMVRFFISHFADTSALDGRGYNAYHTAAENHNTAICKLLLKDNGSLSSSVSANGKTGKQIAAETTFDIE